jgi:uncharacterized protein (TIGR04141 family)
MAINGKKSHKLSIYLIKRNIKSFIEALKDKSSLDEYKLKGTLKLNGIIYVGQTKKNAPGWEELLQQGTDVKLRSLNNTSNRALLMIQNEGRIFALPFGFGKSLLKEDVIEREFGLRTTLNIVDADKLRSMNKANVDDFTVLTTTQTSRRAKPQEFNLDIVRDLIRGVTGQPFSDFEKLGATVTGSEGVYVIPSLHFEDIPTILQMLGKAYKSKRYKERFDWVDNIKNERDPVVLEKLQERLISDLKSKNEELVHLAAPMMIDWEAYEGFSFTPKGDLYLDLNIAAYYSEKETSLNELTWEKLKTQRLFVKYGDRNEQSGVPLLHSLNYQTQLSNQFYVFAFGQWYKIRKNFTQETIDYVNTVRESSLPFIDCDSTWHEETYNENLAASNPNYFLFDQDFVKSGAYRSKVEVCDVLAENEKEFIHVKFKSSSATLSHLFAQGRVSCNLLASDLIFRKNLRAKLKELKIPMRMVPEKQDDFDPSKFTITFAIICGGNKNFVDSLPFFSLLNFRLTVAELRRMHFKVKMKKIKYT